MTLLQQMYAECDQPHRYTHESTSLYTGHSMQVCNTDCVMTNCLSNSLIRIHIQIRQKHRCLSIIAIWHKKLQLMEGTERDIWTNTHKLHITGIMTPVAHLYHFWFWSYSRSFVAQRIQCNLLYVKMKAECMFWSNAVVRFNLPARLTLFNTLHPVSSQAGLTFLSQ